MEVFRRWWRGLFWDEKFVFVCTVIGVICTAINGIKLVFR